MKHVVIAGGGFAGVRLTRQLRKQKDVTVTLINNSADFRYSPALYRAATSFKLGFARLPLEWMLLDSDNATLKVGSVTRLDTQRKLIHLEDGQTIPYDFVVFALGSVTTYFGIDGIERYSYGVKSPEEVHKLKQHVHSNLLNPKTASQDYVVIGAGPTGVELAGALGAYLKSAAKRHHITYGHIKVHLIEAGPRILPQMSERASSRALSALKKLRVNVHTNTKVESETVDALKTSLGDINTDNVIWTAGTANNSFFMHQPDTFKLDKRGRVVVSEHLESSHDVYVCGDNASTAHSGLALTAIEHANYIAKDLRARLKNKKRPLLRERSPIQVIPVTDRFAVLQYKKLVIAGRSMSYVRRIADLLGYADVLGILMAFTVWRNSEEVEKICDICGK